MNSAPVHYSADPRRVVCAFCSKALLVSLSRLSSLRQVQESISEIPCGTLGTPVTRSGCCGRTPGTWAGRTRCPTAGSCSTGPRWATSGRRTTTLTLHWKQNTPSLCTSEPSLPGAGLTQHCPQGHARAPRLRAMAHRKGGGSEAQADRLDFRTKLRVEGPSGGDLGIVLFCHVLQRSLRVDTLTCVRRNVWPSLHPHLPCDPLGPV